MPEEVAVALTYNRTTHAVMMATPQDLRISPSGFSLAEGIIDEAGHIEETGRGAAPRWASNCGCGSRPSG